MKTQACFIVIHRNYADGTDAYAFWNEASARKSILDDVNITVRSLKDSGYKDVEVLERTDECEVYVPDTDIYYEWSVSTSSIE